MNQPNQTNKPASNLVNQASEKMFKPKQNPSLPKTRLLIIMMAIILAVIVAGLVVYFVIVKINNDKKVELEQQTEELEQQTNEVLEEIAAWLEEEGESIKDKQAFDIYNSQEDDYINNPARIRGKALFYGGIVNIKVIDSNGDVLGETNDIVGELSESPYSYREWEYEVELNYKKPKTEEGTIEVCMQAENICKTVAVKFASIVNDLGVYTNKEAGFSLSFPSNVIFNGSYDELSMNFWVEKIDSLEYPMNNKDNALKHRQSLDIGQLDKDIRVDFMIEGSREIEKINDHYGESFMALGAFRVCDFRFERRLIFYNNDYQIIIILRGPIEGIINESLKYLTEEYKISSESNEVCHWWGDNMMEEQFYQDLDEGKGSPIAQEWFDAFDEIVSTIKFLN